MWTPTHVIVTILKGRNLLEKGKGGNDAYCMIGMGKEKFLTSVKTKTALPQWDEQAEFSLGEREDLKITVFHKSSIIDEFIGRVVINVADLSFEHSKSFTNWYKLSGKDDKVDKKKPDKERGELEIRIEFVIRPKAGSMMDLSMKSKENSLSLKNLRDKSSSIKHSFGEKFKILNKSRKSKYAGENQLAEQSNRMAGSKLDFLDGEDVASLASSYSSINGPTLYKSAVANNNGQNSFNRLNSARASFISKSSSKQDNDGNSSNNENNNNNNNNNNDDFLIDEQTANTYNDDEFDSESNNNFNASFNRRNSSRFGMRRQASRRSANSISSSQSTSNVNNQQQENNVAKTNSPFTNKKKENETLNETTNELNDSLVASSYSSSSNQLKSNNNQIHIAPLPPFTSTSTPTTVNNVKQNNNVKEEQASIITPRSNNQIKSKQYHQRHDVANSIIDEENASSSLIKRPSSITNKSDNINKNKKKENEESFEAAFALHFPSFNKNHSEEDDGKPDEKEDQEKLNSNRSSSDSLENNNDYLLKRFDRPKSFTKIVSKKSSQQSPPLPPLPPLPSQRPVVDNSTAKTNNDSMPPLENITAKSNNSSSSSVSNDVNKTNALQSAALTTTFDDDWFNLSDKDIPIEPTTTTTSKMTTNSSFDRNKDSIKQETKSKATSNSSTDSINNSLVDFSRAFDTTNKKLNLYDPFESLTKTNQNNNNNNNNNIINSNKLASSSSSSIEQDNLGNKKINKENINNNGQYKDLFSDIFSDFYSNESTTSADKRGGELLSNKQAEHQQQLTKPTSFPVNLNKNNNQQQQQQQSQLQRNFPSEKIFSIDIDPFSSSSSSSATSSRATTPVSESNKNKLPFVLEEEKKNNFTDSFDLFQHNSRKKKIEDPFFDSLKSIEEITNHNTKMTDSVQANEINEEMLRYNENSLESSNTFETNDSNKPNNNSNNSNNNNELITEIPSVTLEDIENEMNAKLSTKNSNGNNNDNDTESSDSYNIQPNVPKLQSRQASLAVANSSINIKDPFVQLEKENRTESENKQNGNKDGEDDEENDNDDVEEFDMDNAFSTFKGQKVESKTNEMSSLGQELREMNQQLSDLNSNEMSDYNQNIDLALRRGETALKANGFRMDDNVKFDESEGEGDEEIDLDERGHSSKVDQSGPFSKNTILRQSERRRLMPVVDLTSDLNSETDFNTNDSSLNSSSTKFEKNLAVNGNGKESGLKSSSKASPNGSLANSNIHNYDYDDEEAAKLDFRLMNGDGEKKSTLGSNDRTNGLPDLVNQKTNEKGASSDKAKKFIEDIDGVKFNEIQVPDTLKKQLEYFDRDELLQLIAYQKKYLDYKESRIKDLENYIDNLVVKIIETEPLILMNASNVLNKSRNLI